MAESIPMHSRSPSTRLGGRAYAHHRDDDDTEREYDRLRDLARAEASKRNSCFDRAHEAYEQGDGAGAKQLSNEGKSHAAKMEQYNKQASEYIFRANNSTEKVPSDTIDLHGQFVEEAEDILEARIRDAQARSQTHLHVIVGKGNHSVGHVQKLKPRVEHLCQELGLQYRTEENEGRIYVNLQGHDIPHMPPPPSNYSGGGYGGGGGHHGGKQQQHHGQPQHGQQHPRPPANAGQQPQEQQQEDGTEKLKKKVIEKLTKKLGDCCVVIQNTNITPASETISLIAESLSTIYCPFNPFNPSIYHEINLTLTIPLTRHAYTLCATTETKQQRPPSQTPHPHTSPTQHVLSGVGRKPLPLVQPTAHDMGEHVEPTAQAPSPPSAPAASLSLLLSKKALDASRTEILVLASGILFLASQVCLLVWFFSGGPRGASAKKGQRKVSIVLSPETEPPSQVTLAAYDDGAKVTGSSSTNGNEDSPLRLRRSSSWGGRSSHLGSLTRGRRKSAGSRLVAQDSGDDDDKEEAEGEKQGVKTSLSSPGPEPEPGPKTDHVALAAFGGIGRMAAALAAPASLPLPSAGDEIGGRGGGAEGMELREFDPRRAWGEAGLLGASIEKPRSPRSPRVLAADQAAMMDALCAEEGEKEDWKAAAPSPVGGIEEDPPALSPGFDDPLGVNRLVALPGEEEGPEGIELEARE